MAIIRGLSGVAITLDVSVSVIASWIARGLPHERKGFTYYFNTKAISKWLREESNRKYGHLADVLDKYKD